MNTYTNKAHDLAGPLEVVRGRLTLYDDPDFWEAALTVLAQEFVQRFSEERGTRRSVLQIGPCSHWVRPHQTRWTAAGGFAYPEGYQNSLPAFDWYALLGFQASRWVPLEKLPSKRSVVFRAALPVRTARHKQAAIHTKWSISEQPVFYGFRNVDGTWRCVAVSDEQLEGPVTAGQPHVSALGLHISGPKT
jgi:hypothetical protein